MRNGGVAAASVSISATKTAVALWLKLASAASGAWRSLKYGISGGGGIGMLRGSGA